MVYRSALAIALAFALTACGQSAQEPAPAPRSWWSESHGVGMELGLNQSGVRLTLVCHAEPAVMQLHVGSFRPIGSEERMSFGAGDDVYVFVAQLDEERPGVTGEREISAALLDALSADRVWRVNYGAQNAGPFDAPPASAIETFAAACREIVTG